MENNEIQDSIKEIRSAIQKETITMNIHFDDPNMVEHSQRLIANYKVNIQRLERAAKGLPIEEEIVKTEIRNGAHFIQEIWRRVYLFVTFRAKMEPVTELFQTLSPSVISKDESFFATKNNIMEGAWEAPAIEASNWKHIDRYIWPIEVEYKGFMVLAEDVEDADNKRRMIDEGITSGKYVSFYTVQQFQEKFYPAPVLNEEVEKFENDIEFLAQKQMEAPDYEEKTVRLQLTQGSQDLEK